MDLGAVRELSAAVRALHRSGRQAVPPVVGLPRGAVRLLGVIARHAGDGMRPGGIADELGMTSSNVAAGLRELDHAGLIDRRRDSADGRQVVVELTERGAAAVAEHRSLKVDALRDAIEEALSDAEKAQLTSAIPLLQRIAAAQVGRR
jgi:DNA-binding MarR family transcriptional regulator